MVATELVSPTDVVRVFECTLNLLEITLLGENISPSASMEIEQNVDMIKNMIKNLRAIPKDTFQLPPSPSGSGSVKRDKSKMSLKKKDKTPAVVVKDITEEPSVPEKRKDEVVKEIKPEAPMKVAPPCLPPVIIDEDTYEITDGGPPTVTHDGGQSPQVTHDAGGQSVVIIEDDTYEITDTTSDTSSMTSSLTTSSVGHHSHISSDEIERHLKTFQELSPEELLKRDPTFSGYLQKHKKNRLIGQWNRRYCILKDSFLFYYKSDSTSNKEKGVIILTGYQLSLSAKDSKSYCFSLTPLDKSRGDAYTFQADTSDEYEKWKSYLSEVINKTYGEMSRGLSRDQAVDEQEGEMYEQFPNEQKEVLSVEPDVSTFTMDNIYMGLHDCTGTESDELSFQSGDVLYILERLSTNWWLGYLNGKCGYVPANYLTEAFEQ